MRDAADFLRIAAALSGSSDELRDGQGDGDGSTGAASGLLGSPLGTPLASSGPGGGCALSPASFDTFGQRRGRPGVPATDLRTELEAARRLARSERAGSADADSILDDLAHQPPDLLTDDDFDSELEVARRLASALDRLLAVDGGGSRTAGEKATRRSAGGKKTGDRRGEKTEDCEEERHDDLLVVGSSSDEWNSGWDDNDGGSPRDGGPEDGGFDAFGMTGHGASLQAAEDAGGFALDGDGFGTGAGGFEPFGPGDAPFATSGFGDFRQPAAEGGGRASFGGASAEFEGASAFSAFRPTPPRKNGGAGAGRPKISVRIDGAPNLPGDGTPPLPSEVDGGPCFPGGWGLAFAPSAQAAAEAIAETSSLSMSASTASSPSAARVPSLPPPRKSGAGLLRGILPSPSAGDDPANKDDGWQRTVAGLARGSPRKAAADALHRFRKAPLATKVRRRSGGFRRAAEGQCEQLV